MNLLIFGVILSIIANSLPMVEANNGVGSPSLMSSLVYMGGYGQLSLVVYAPQNSSTPIKQLTVDLGGIIISTNLKANSLVATYEPTTQSFYVWIQNNYFFEIGALNGVVLSLGSTIGPQFTVVAACADFFNPLDALSITPGNIYYAFSANTVNDQGGAATTTYFAPGSGVATLSRLCATSAVEPALFYPFSQDGSYPPKLYLITNRSTSALPVNSDHMSLINNLATFSGPFDGEAEATRAIYVLDLQTSIPVKVVTVTNSNTESQATTVTLPLTVPNYQTQYVFSNQILRSVSAFIPKTSTYIFPLLKLSSNTVTYMMTTATQTPTSAVPFDTSSPSMQSNIVLAIAAFP